MQTDDDETIAPAPTVPAHVVTRVLVNRGERIAWLACGAMFMYLMVDKVWSHISPPPPTATYVPVYVDPVGRAKLATELTKATLTPQEALEKHDLERWATAFHSYSYDFLPRDWHTVECMSPQPIFDQYRAQFEKPDAEDYINVNSVQGKVKREARVVDTVLLGDNQSGGRDARITLEKVTTYKERPADQQPAPVRVVLTLQYRYDMRLKLQPECRSENPLGFVMLVRRADAQMSAPAAAPRQPGGGA